MTELRIELVMSEFTQLRPNAGGNKLDHLDRLNPTLDSFRNIFPSAHVTLYTDQEIQKYEGVHVVMVDPPFDRCAPRYGWRAHDYYQSFGMLQSSADVAIAMDSDMLIVSDSFRVIYQFAQRFGLAVPINPRLLLKIDGGVGVDSTYIAQSDSTQGLGITYNLSPMAFSTHHHKARQLLEHYCALLVQSPGRGAVHLVQASYELGYQPFVLPPQWCVCSPRDLDSKHLWREALALHVGHRDVLPRWKKENKLVNIRELLYKIIGRK